MEVTKMKRRLSEVKRRLKDLQKKPIWNGSDLELASVLEEEIAILKEKIQDERFN